MTWQHKQGFLQWCRPHKFLLPGSIISLVFTVIKCLNNCCCREECVLTCIDSGCWAWHHWNWMPHLDQLNLMRSPCSHLSFCLPACLAAEFLGNICLLVVCNPTSNTSCKNLNTAGRSMIKKAPQREMWALERQHHAAAILKTPGVYMPQQKEPSICSAVWMWYVAALTAAYCGKNKCKGSCDHICFFFILQDSLRNVQMQSSKHLDTLENHCKIKQIEITYTVYAASTICTKFILILLLIDPF